MRSNPRKVQLHDLETYKVVPYPSIYKAALAWDQNTGVIGMHNGKYAGTGISSKVLTKSY